MLLKQDLKSFSKCNQLNIQLFLVFLTEHTMSQENLNLIIIVSDTFRADHVGCYGNERVKTPSLDKLASEGIKFTNVYADGLPTIPERRVL